jgi:DNA-binding response OmpR family regulator
MTADNPRPILVVEDEDGLRESIQWLLEDEGWPVAVAADGKEALQQAGAQRPSLVVLDMALPVLNGDAVADGLRRLYRNEVPILVITADGRAAAKARRVGAYAYLPKPFSFDDFLDRVQRGLARSR